MACLEHICGECDMHKFDNEIWDNCKKCGSLSISNLFDEQYDYAQELFEFEPSEHDQEIEVCL